MTAAPVIDAHSNERNYGVDLLRIVVMLMIILRHASFHSGVTSVADVPKLNYLLGVGIANFTGIAVNCFVLVSGYFLCKQSFRFERIFKLYLALYFYSVVVCIAAYFIPEYQLTKANILKCLLPLSLEFSWYMSLYLTISVLAPFFNILINGISQKQYLALLGIMLFCFSIVPSFNVCTFSKVGGYSLSWFVMLYFTGAYIRLYVRHHSTGLWLGGFIISMAIIFAYLILRLVAKKYDIELTHPDNYDFLPTFLASTMLVCLFKEINVPKFLNKIISFIAPGLIGCYLLHDNFLNQILWKSWFKNNAYVNDKTWLIHIIASVAIVFIAGCCVDFIRQQIFKTKLVNNLISAVSRKIQF